MKGDLFEDESSIWTLALRNHRGTANPQFYFHNMENHLTKAITEDVMDTFSGTLGLTGAADCLLAMATDENSRVVTLHITGRDVQATKFGLSFHPKTLSWKILGNVQEIQSTPQQQRLYDAIRYSPTPLSPKEIAEVSGLDHQYVKNTLPKLLEEGCIRKLEERGKYECVNTQI